jgi:glycosyltransferase involved in cell wall biosynthesis
VGSKLPSLITAWTTALAKTGRSWELLIVDQGSTDDTLAVAQSATEGKSSIRLLPTPVNPGTGSCFRAAVEASTHPLIGFVTTDYPYSPADLPRFLAEIQRSEVVYDRTFDVVLVNGCRRGVPVPGFWSGLGWCVRNFMRWALGFPVAPLPGWLGLKEHVRAWYAWAMYGNPFQDPNCGFKLMRRSLISSFPLQSYGDFVNVELIGKTTFLTNLTAEVELTPSPTPVPSPDWTREDRKEVFRNPQFIQTLSPATPEEPAPAPA